jgi:hypothetical protein
MAKPKINRHRRKAITTKRLATLLKQHLFDTGMVTAYVDPPFTPEEHAQARFQANAITSQLNAAASPEAQGPASRIAALTEVTLYRMRVQGVINYLNSLMETDKVTKTAKEIDAVRAKVAAHEDPGQHAKDSMEITYDDN